jgi:hypothetical protein
MRSPTRAAGVPLLAEIPQVGPAPRRHGTETQERRLGLATYATTSDVRHPPGWQQVDGHTAAGAGLLKVHA